MHIGKKIAIGLTIAAISGAVVAGTATKYGNSTYYSDGGSATDYGNSTYYSDGTSATDYGNSRYYSR